MATIRTAIALYDGMTSPLQSMNAALNIVLNSFEAVQSTSSQAVDVNAIQAAREELARSAVAFDAIEENIQRANNQQLRFNQSIQGGSSAVDGMLSKVRGIAAAIGAGIGVQKIIGLSDNLAGAEARLNLIVDDGGSVQELQNKIFASAQASRGAYLDTMQVVSKLGLMAGDAFSGNDEMIKFTELMNKNFIIGGSSIQEQTSAMYQLTQAMASGKLQGDEYRSIIENAPLLAKSIEKYMQASGVEGTMKEWASDGLLTAEVIRASLFSSADEIEDRFAEMPMTWGQVWTNMQNRAIQAFDPILTKINEVANSEKFQKVTGGIINGLYTVASVASWVFDLMVGIGSGIYDNWSIIEPVVLGIVAVLSAYEAAILANAVATGIDGAAKAIAAVQAYIHATAILANKAAYDAQAIAAAQATIAQASFNTALLACPVTWIVVGIIAIIAVIYAVVAAINYFTGSSISATGIIMGAFAVLGAFIFNSVVVPTWNAFVDFTNFLGNVFNDPVAAIKVLFYDMAQTIIGYILNMANAIEAVINKIPGVQVDITGGLDGLYNQIEEASRRVKDESGWIEYMARVDYIDLGGAAKTGYDVGGNIDKGVGDFFNFNTPESNVPTYEIPNDIYNGIGDTAANTARMADTMDLTNEDLKYWRDIAEREAVNQFTNNTIVPKLQVSFGDVRETADADKLYGRITKIVEDELAALAEGVHK